ncbi:MAG TPA: 5'-3' exonuclease H3TH domain-containing protein, partial [Candidatus Sulfotelmatobacter sp.]|nr:5'-3' exonuclease H3TH domain-containing protein [Candidatus Sulfotelmatobacter sp.]
DFAAALFDRPEPTFRKKAYAEYKATRPTAPDELVEQIIAAHELFQKFGIPVFEAPGYEADDLIATVARRFGGREGVRVVILTGDLDTLQLVRDGKVAVRVFRKGVTETTTYDEAAVYERYGLRPEQLIDYKALVGDASDNIKGVPGVGPKTAVSWLTRYKDLDDVLAHVGKDPILKKLSGHEAAACLSRELVALAGNAPLSANDLRSLEVSFKETELADYFDNLGFTSLSKRLFNKKTGPAGAGPANQPRPPQGAMF